MPDSLFSPRIRHRRAAGLTLISVLVAGLYLAAEWTVLDGELGLPLDDGWIHLTFARNLADGAGLVYNPGEPVAGSTAPLWTALLAPGLAVTRDAGGAVVWAKLLSAALFLLIAPATYRLARTLGVGRGLAWTGAAMTAATSWLAWSALSGMEVCLFTALTVWGLALHAREKAEPERPPLALGLFGLAALVRPEGVLLLGLAVLDAACVPRRSADGLLYERPPWRRIGLGLALAAAALAPPLLGALALFGSVEPTTFAAKSGGLHPPQGRVLFAALGIFFQPQPWATLLAGGGALALIARAGTASRAGRGLLPVLWAIGLPLAYSVLSPPERTLLGNFGRYLFPLLPVVVVLGLVGIETAVAAAGRGFSPRAVLGRTRLPTRALLVTLFVLPTLLSLVAGAGRFARNVADVTDGDVAAARWVRENLPADAVLAVQDIGALGYLTDNRLIDLSGIATPEVVPAVRASQHAGDRSGQAGMEAFVAAARPDYLIVFEGWYPEITADRSHFSPLHRIEIAGNVTLAGDRIVVWAYNPGP